MRDNTAALMAIPEFSVQTGTDGAPFGMLRFNSVSHAHEACKRYARTDNENGWKSPGFLGLGDQTLHSFDTTGQSTRATELTKTAAAALPKIRNKPGKIGPAVTGGYWDIPSLQAGLPLAARAKQRTKLAPKNIRIFCAYSGMIDSEFMAPISARIAKAIWDYTLEGGVVTLTVFSGGQISNPACGGQGIIETRANASDISAIALALSPAYMRGISCAMVCALSNTPHESIPIIRKQIIPNAYFMSGIGREIEKAAAAVIEALQIA